MSLPRVRRAMLVLDVVESVRLMQDAEDDTIERWCRYVDEVRAQVLPEHSGRMVKSLGDGMLLEFPAALQAVRAALDAKQRIRAYNAGRPAEQQLHLRLGVHATEIVVGELDVFGAGVNLAARLATLAGPDEIILSPEARDEVVPDLDVDIEDLGEVYLKHLKAPQRAFRAGPVGLRSPMWSDRSAGGAEQLVLAVIPFAVSGAGPEQHLVGEVLADDLIARLSQLQQLRVISRLSTTVFRDRPADLQAITTALGCDVLLHGSCFVRGDRLRVRAQWIDRRTPSGFTENRADALEGSVSDLMSGSSDLVDRCARAVLRALDLPDVDPDGG